MRRGLEVFQRLLTRPVVRGAKTRLYEALLVAWFTLLTTGMIIRPIVEGLKHPLAIDTIVYTHAARALVDGGNPWRVVVFDIGFAAPPPSLLPFIPLVGLSDDALVVVGVGVASLSAIYAVRALHLPLWWLLFPPVAIGIAAGSWALPTLALLVRGGAVADGAALLTRAYAGLPLVAQLRWKGIVAAAVAVAVTAPFVGWSTYLGDSQHVADVLRTQAGDGSSATAIPLLVPWVAILLAFIGRRRAAWLLVPFLWPNSQFHYESIALPVLAEMPLIAAGLAFHSVVVSVLALTGQAAIDLLAGRRPFDMSLQESVAAQDEEAVAPA